ncbi:MAG: class I SAM-dependent methyltransferase, partial [Deltaproteobacteria bacterium]
NSTLYSIDHHHGSEEQQIGEQYFDKELFDSHLGCVNTLNHFRVTLKNFELEKTVVTIVANSLDVAKNWHTPLSMVFIDGGHSFDAVYNDYNCWVSHLIFGGFLAIHDIFSDTSQGGQAPRCIYEMALSSGLFIELPRINTLGILKRVSCGEISHIAKTRYSSYLI